MQFNVFIVDSSHLRLAQFEAAPRLQAGSSTGGQVLVSEDLPQCVGVDFAAVGVGVTLDDPREFDLQSARQFQVVCP